MWEKGDKEAFIFPIPLVFDLFLMDFLKAIRRA
jgi:hypothetical protein